MHPDPSAFDNTPYAQRIDKPWGHELLFTPPDSPYAGKLLHVDAGRRLSLQIHEEKAETILLFSGRALLQVDNQRGELESIEMRPGMGYSVAPGQRHRLVAIDDCVFVEASTPETGTTYRLEDDAGRGNETAAMRGARNRGWPSTV